MIRIPHRYAPGGGSCFRPAFTVLLISVVAMAMIGAFVLIDWDVPVEAAEADSGTCGDSLNWSIDENGKLTITGTGQMQDYGLHDTRWNGKTVKTVVIGNGVTSIGSRAFSRCDQLTSVAIPDSMTSIGVGAFEKCSGLISITIPSRVTIIGIGTFDGCSSLTSVTIPNRVTSIGDGAFCLCVSLTEITIPDGVTSIGLSAFQGCSSLTSINIPDSVTEIGSYAFTGCSSLTSVTIPNGVTKIEDQTFSGCTGLTSVTIPDGVTSIGSDAFWSCTSLTSINIPDGVTNLGIKAFYGCEKLLRISFGQNMTLMSAAMIRDAFPDHTFYAEDEGTALSTANLSDFKGYTFRGLSTDKMIRGWAPSHHVTYDIGEGSGDAPTQDDVREELRFTVKDYSGTRTGYTFGGWSYNGSTYLAGDTIDMGTRDIFLTAIWNPEIRIVTHTVTYDIGEGSGDAPTQEPVQEGVEFEVKDYSGTKTGYTFGGWIWNDTTYQAGDAIEMGTSNIVLEAIWSKNQTFVPIPGWNDEPVIPVFPDQTSKDSNDDSTSAVIIAAGCVVILLAILVLMGSDRIRR